MPIMLHLSCDKYQGELLDRDTSDGSTLCYSTTRMLPPGPLTYYYSVNGEQHALQMTDPIIDSEQTKLCGMKLLKLEVPRTNIVENVV